MRSAVRGLAALAIALALAPPARANWLGAAAAHEDREGPIAVWSATELAVSRNDGASFTTLAMPVTNVRRVLVERSGALLVLGGTAGGEQALLTRVHPDGALEPIEVPGWISAIETGGDVLVGLMPYEGSVVISRSRGPLATYRLPPLFDRAACTEDGAADAAALAECLAERSISTDASVAVDRDGTAHVVDVEVNTCGSSDRLEWARTITVHPDGHARDARLRITPVDPVYPTRWTAAWRGWSYALASDGRLASLVAGRTRVLEGARGEASPGGTALATVGNGAITLAQVGRGVVRLDGDRARVLVTLEGDADLADVDARGRVLALSADALRRWSRRSGWETLTSAR